MKQFEQFTFDFDAEEHPVLDNPVLWTPRDIWVHLNQGVLEAFKEDRRLERKNHVKPNLDDLAIYFSAFSNTPDGGLLVYGVANNGTIEGCPFTINQLNDIESSHINRCPNAKPEFKRIPVIVNGEQQFCFAIFSPYVGTLVETNKGEAYIRYGESVHKMSEEEKQDFRSTRQELSFEQTVASSYQYPADFDLRVVQDFCDKYREKELKPEWTNQEVLIDRHLLRIVEGTLRPLNAFVLMASKDPGMAIPGCRVRMTCPLPAVPV